MSNRLLKLISLSLVTGVLFAQVVDQQHLHINEPAGTVCEVCTHSDHHAVATSGVDTTSIDANETVRYEAAVSATLAVKRWARRSRAPPLVLT